jgi:hypothetical protein
MTNAHVIALKILFSPCYYPEHSSFIAERACTHWDHEKRHPNTKQMHIQEQISNYTEVNKLN